MLYLTFGPVWAAPEGLMKGGLSRIRAQDFSRNEQVRKWLLCKFMPPMLDEKLKRRHLKLTEPRSLFHRRKNLKGQSDLNELPLKNG